MGGGSGDSTGAVDEIVEQNLRVYEASSSRLQEDVSQEAQVASDYRGRLVYELLQNSDDAMADAPTTDDRVSILVTDSELWIANTGRDLTAADVHGLCGLGASSKIDHSGARRASIGHKGLGFKSVLEITDKPRVYSHSHRFALGVDHARGPVESLWRKLGRPLSGSLPAMRFPAAIDTVDEQWNEYARAGFNVAFCFPFRDSLDKDDRRRIADLLLELPLTTVVFLKHLERIDIRVAQRDRSEARTWRVTREHQAPGTEGWLPSSGLQASGAYRISVSGDDQAMAFLVAHDADVAIDGNRTGLSGPAWEGVELTEISVATPEPGGPSLPSVWRNFHVFLPTAEACPYPILINGAFSTDLSRQQVRVSETQGDYNAHLVRQAARLVCEELAPLLGVAGHGAVLNALERDPARADGAAAALLHQAIVEELADVPILPAEDGPTLTLRQAVLPPGILDAEGSRFREVLTSQATWDGGTFPAAEFCVGRWARIASDHGALELEVVESLPVLAGIHDPQRAKSQDHDSGGFEVDPVLELCTTLWERTSGVERQELEDCAKNEALFPVDRSGDDRTIERVAVGDTPVFYPPQTARQQLPLRDLRFMCHPLCWGALNRNERATQLADRLSAWASLFGVQEFRFETVVQTAVNPALSLRRSSEADERLTALRELDALVAICRLAGRQQVKPDRPLRYQRLESDRTSFPLSRLPVPCRSTAGDLTWEPAYKVYFGADWTDDESVERIADAIGEAGRPEFSYLAPPEVLVPLLDEGFQDGEEEQPEDDDDVDPDESADEALEGSARERWIAFLSWIGVNRCLRPIHFHDVEDGATGWLTTRDLAQPQGWAFRDLTETWQTFVTDVRESLDAHPTSTSATPYFYEVHDLDQFRPIVAAAEGDAGGHVARSLVTHLIRHWSRYSSLAECQVALIESSSPGQRKKPQKASSDEITPAGDNLWLHRLSRSGICPTALGPRVPSLTWRPSLELENRFARRGRSAAELLPVLTVGDGLPAQAINGVAERLGVRAEPSPSTFTLQDARMLCQQLEHLYSGPRGRTIDAVALREVFKPVYRQLFELLSGRQGIDNRDQAPLIDVPLLAETEDGYRFRRAGGLLYAATPGLRERSGVADLLPMPRPRFTGHSGEQSDHATVACASACRCSRASAGVR